MYRLGQETVPLINGDSGVQQYSLILWVCSIEVILLGC